MSAKEFERLLSKPEGKRNSLLKTIITQEAAKYEITKDTPLQDPLLQTPFTNVLPFERWQGKTSSILKLNCRDNKYLWIYFQLDDPKSYQNLISQSMNKSEMIFFSNTNQKYYRLANDCLHWSYYATGPFQRLEGMVRIPATDKVATEADFTMIEGIDKCLYMLNNLTGLFQDITSEVEKLLNEKGGTSQGSSKANITSKQDITVDTSKFGEMLEALREKREKELKKFDDNKLFSQIDSLLEGVYQNADYQAWKEAILKGEDTEIPAIKSNKIMKVFEEITQIYDIDFENLRDTRVPISNLSFSLFSVESINDVKFNLGVILSELCLYPKSLLKSIFFSRMLFCGNIYEKEKQLTFKMSCPELAINCKEKNVMKIQKGFHLSISQLIYNMILGEIGEAVNVWCALNPTDFVYQSQRPKVPKGLKGFITFNSTLTEGCDMSEVFYALIKDPETMLNHSDIIIAKKSHLLKKILEALWPGVITEGWWKRVKDYKDVIEQSLSATDYYKEAKFEEDQIEDK